jgi:hypothetical protein
VHLIAMLLLGKTPTTTKSSFRQANYNELSRALQAT